MQINMLCQDEKQFMLRYGRNCNKRLYFGDVRQFIVNYGRAFVDVEWRPVGVGWRPVVVRWSPLESYGSVMSQLWVSYGSVMDQ